MKPDIICGTESWIKGIKPGKEPVKTVLKTVKSFPITLTLIGTTE